MKRAQRLDGARALTLVTRFFEEASRNKNLRSLLRGLLTYDQQRTIAQRLWIALLLREGYSFRSLREQTGAALATIAEVHRWLNEQYPRYRPLLPLRQRARDMRRQKTAPFQDTHRGLPGSIKHWFRGVAGAAPF